MISNVLAVSSFVAVVAVPVRLPIKVAAVPVVELTIPEEI